MGEELHFDKRKFTKAQVKGLTQGQGRVHISETKNFHVVKKLMPVKHTKIHPGIVKKSFDKDASVQLLKKEVALLAKSKNKDIDMKKIEKEVEDLATGLVELLPTIEQGVIKLALKMFKDIGLPTEDVEKLIKKIEAIDQKLVHSLFAVIVPILISVIISFIGGDKLESFLTSFK